MHVGLTSLKGKIAAVLLGCAATAGLVIVIEGAFWVLNRQRASRESLNHDPQDALYEFRLTVGYRPQALSRVAATKTLDGKVLYDVAYTFDEHHRRQVPVEGIAQRPRFIALFGGSFAFGEGVNDSETLACYLAELAPSFCVYNYGFSGYGPQQALVLLSDEGFPEQVSQSEGLGIYVMVPGHVRRAIGSLRVVTQWGRHFPCFVLDEQEGLVQRQTFKLARPWRTWLYQYGAREQVMRYFNVDWPLRLSDRHVELTCRILEQAREAFRELFGSDSFYVLVYPPHPMDEIPSGRVAQALRRRGMHVLDYGGCVDMCSDGMLIEHDLHPTGQAYERIGAMVVKDLGIESGRFQ